MPAQFPIIFGIAAIVLIAIVTTLVALYAWMTSPAKVLDARRRWQSGGR